MKISKTYMAPLVTCISLGSVTMILSGSNYDSDEPEGYNVDSSEYDW